MRIFALIGLAVFLQACAVTRDQASSGKTSFLPEAQRRELPPQPVAEPQHVRPETSEDDRKHYGFSLALVPYVASSWASSAVYKDNTLKLVHSGEVEFDGKLTPSQSRSLNAIIETLDRDVWSGFYVYSGVLDGDMVACRVKRGGETLAFRGSNGSPRGFAALLSEINAIAERDFFPDDWAKQEWGSEWYEDEEDMMSQLKALQAGERGAPVRRPARDESENEPGLER